MMPNNAFREDGSYANEREKQKVRIQYRMTRPDLVDFGIQNKRLNLV